MQGNNARQIRKNSQPAAGFILKIAAGIYENENWGKPGRLKYPSCIVIVKWENWH